MTIFAWKRGIPCTLGLLVASFSFAQMSDTMYSFEMGGRAYGMGGSIYSNSADASASYWNPACLGLVQTTLVEAVMRNRPISQTHLTGTIEDGLDGTGELGYGFQSLSFGGVAWPFRGGTLGLSYAVGGYVRQNGFGEDTTSSSAGGPLTAQTLFRSMTEFFTVAYGRPMGQNSNIGVGVVVARQSLSDKAHVFFTGDPDSIVLSGGFDDLGSGVGAIVGYQFTPPGRQNVSIGASYRSEINLSGIDSGSSHIDVIPARLQGGLAFRVDGLRGGRDFLIGGVDVMYIFPGNDGKVLENDGQFSAGIGLEYNWTQSFGYLPIRIGFRFIDKSIKRQVALQEDPFIARQIVTFGIGYRPKNAPYSLELNLAAGNKQNTPDIALGLQFEVRK
ncbi:MAG TPA: hypothetical protein VNK96_07210 [Fimbriimonadales bacterium]|nr:hypothetical protein [Fimbriimonadales bacterium]